MLVNVSKFSQVATEKVGVAAVKSARVKEDKTVSVPRRSAGEGAAVLPWGWASALGQGLWDLDLWGRP